MFGQLVSVLNEWSAWRLKYCGIYCGSFLKTDFASRKNVYCTGLQRKQNHSIILGTGPDQDPDPTHARMHAHTVTEVTHVQD